MSELTQRQRSPSPTQQPRRALSPEQVQARTNAAKAMKKRSSVEPNFFERYAYQLVIGGFVLLCLFALFSILTRTKKSSASPIVDQEEIDSHNSLGTFTQGANEFFQNWKISDAKFIFNNHLTFKGKVSQCPETAEIVPEAYNFREEFQQCAQPVYNQGNCSSSYSIATVSAASDRVCRGRDNFFEQLSPQSPISCDDKNYRCGGGSVTRVLELGKKQGFVTRQCQEFKGTEEVLDNCDAVFTNCEKYHVQDYCVTSSEESIKREILTRGPVVVVLPVFKDFLVYKNGVYDVTEGTTKIQHGHAVKVIGWGKTDSTNYWIIENSWGESWGQNGLAYVAIGSSSLEFEKYAVAAIMESPKE